MQKLYRSRSDRKLAGVCGGIAEYFNIDATLVRIITVVLAVVTAAFPFLIAYLILAVVMPNEEDVTS
ncbi:PspC domain-containing protein [Alteribacillus sp. HJP-4]|uniref:PspC domain-containing protein n=1 Tax=Alteribacillus sp. HJP-4 TaxID=2775394 RepID=UPI0035CD0031